MAIRRLRTGGHLFLWSPKVNPAARSQDGELCIDTVTKLLIVGDGVTPWGELAALCGTNSDSFEVHHNFTKDPDGPPPATADSGDTLTRHGEPMAVDDGYAVATGTTGAAAWYVEAHTSQPVYYLALWGRFLEPAGTNASAACVAALNHGLAGGTDDLGSPAHVVVAQDRVDYGVFLGGNGTGPDNFLTQSFSFADVDQDPWFVEAAWNPATGEAAVRDPHGAAHAITDPAVLAAIDIEATYPFCELDYGDLATDTKIGISGFAAAGHVDAAPGVAVTGRGELLLLEARQPAPVETTPTWRIAKSSADVTTTTASGLTNIASDLDVTVPVVPPTGTVIVRLELTVDIAAPTDIGLAVNSTAGLFAAYTQSAEIAAGRRRHQASIVVSGLVPGGSFSFTPQLYTSGDAQIVINAAAFDPAIVIVEPVA